MLHALDIYVRPYKTIEHTFTFRILAGVGSETGIY